MTPAFSAVPQKGEDKIVKLATVALPSRGPESARYTLTPTFLEIPKKEWRKSELASPPKPSWGPEMGWNGYVTPMFSGVLTTGDKIRIGYLILAFSEGQKCAKLLRNAGVLTGPRKGGQNQNRWPNPCLLRGPGQGGTAM